MPHPYQSSIDALVALLVAAVESNDELELDNVVDQCATQADIQSVCFAWWKTVNCTEKWHMPIEAAAWLCALSPETYAVFAPEETCQKSA